MTSLSGLSIGLSLVFGCLLLALVAELYYLLWWKKRIASTDVEDELVKNKSINGVEVEPDLELGSSKEGFEEESVESELMRLHNLAGPPRFLFTIKEETKEDLESEDGTSRSRSRTKSLSDLMLTDDTSPLKSKTLNLKDSYHQRNGFNPLFESSNSAELNKLVRSSPPPKFKFLRDAEEKLLKRLMVLEDEKRVELQRNNGGGIKDVINSKTILTEETEGSFLKFIVPSSSSQILPLASSPTGFQSSDTSLDK